MGAALVRESGGLVLAVVRGKKEFRKRIQYPEFLTEFRIPDSTQNTVQQSEFRAVRGNRNPLLTTLGLRVFLRFL